MLTGVSNGSKADAIDQPIETWLGHSMDVQLLFVPWDDALYEIDDLFGQWLPGVWANGRVPVIAWELNLSSGRSPDNICAEITAGEHDDYLSEWVTQYIDAAGAVDRRAAGIDPEDPLAYVRLAHEMNGNWYQWSPAYEDSDVSAGDYRAMWQYVVRFARERIPEAIRPAWMWCPNGDDVGETTMEELYPGDEYVDWIAVDSYNWGEPEGADWRNWRTAAEQIAPQLGRVRAIPNEHKPTAVPEFATSSIRRNGTHNPGAKDQWIRDTYDLLDEAAVDMAIWFNEDKESDWAVFGGQYGTDTARVDDESYTVYPAFKRALNRLRPDTDDDTGVDQPETDPSEPDEDENAEADEGAGGSEGTGEGEPSEPAWVSEVRREALAIAWHDLGKVGELQVPGGAGESMASEEVTNATHWYAGRCSGALAVLNALGIMDVDGATSGETAGSASSSE